MKAYFVRSDTLDKLTTEVNEVFRRLWSRSTPVVSTQIVDEATSGKWTVMIIANEIPEPEKLKDEGDLH